MHGRAERLGKISPSPCNRGAKPDLFTGGHRQWPRRWIKNTQRRPAGNIRMKDDQPEAFDGRESPTKLVRKDRRNLLIGRVNSHLREPNGRYWIYVEGTGKPCRTFVALRLKFQLPITAFLTKH